MTLSVDTKYKHQSYDSYIQSQTNVTTIDFPSISKTALITLGNYYFLSFTDEPNH